MMSLWSWVRALTEAKEKGKGHAITVLVGGRPLSGWDPSERAPHFNDVPVVLGSSSHGGERKRQGTCHNSTCEWETTKWVGPVGGALTINLTLIPTLSHPTFIGFDRR